MDSFAHYVLTIDDSDSHLPLGHFAIHFRKQNTNKKESIESRNGESITQCTFNAFVLSVAILSFSARNVLIVDCKSPAAAIPSLKSINVISVGSSAGFNFTDPNWNCKSKENMPSYVIVLDGEVV